MTALYKMIQQGSCQFKPLHFSTINNQSILAANTPEMAQEEICLFYNEITSGDQYLQAIHQELSKAFTQKRALPVVRFADGEYAFYQKSLHCNGLYEQAESVKAIEESLAFHKDSLVRLSKTGKLAPLIHPGNSTIIKKSFFSIFKKKKHDDSALKFIEFIDSAGVNLTKDNYIPFYVVYAYLTSIYFAKLMDGKNLIILNSDNDYDSCVRWFRRFDSRPKISFVDLPRSYMATRWEERKEEIMAKIPKHPDLCLVGAGIGSILICVDIAERFNIPAIDGGHVLNMLNTREDKSNGPRLYTIHS